MITQTTPPQSNTAYRQCTKCVLDTIDDPHMSFDADGVCNYYHQYLKTAKKHLPAAAQRDHLLEQKLAEIKNDGKGKDYDVVVGLSGGVDSTYVALLASNLASVFWAFISTTGGTRNWQLKILKVL